IVQYVLCASNHILGHRGVDLLCQFHKPEGVAELGSHVVGKVIGVDGNAVSPNAGAGIERLETKRLGFCGVDNVPKVNSKLMTKLRHLVDKRDVDVPVGILHQFCCFSLSCAAGFYHFVNELAIKIDCSVGARRCMASDDFRSVFSSELFVSWVDALRGEDQVEVFTSASAGALEDGAKNLIRRGGIRS